MTDLLSQLRLLPCALRVGDTTLRVTDQAFFGPERTHGVALSGTGDYLNEVLLAPEHREQTYRVIDTFGLLICRDVRSDHPGYREVRGRSSRGRLSQGEYYHHDGCSGPTKPRVVEIRFPHQATARDVATAVAPFPQTVYAMLRHAPRVLALDERLQQWLRELQDRRELDVDVVDVVQGLVTRSIRKELEAEAARAFFREVDALVGAYRAPWQMGESRLISNRHPTTDAMGTMQHRRAYLRPHTGGVATGSLVKRWPAEEIV